MRLPNYLPPIVNLIIFMGVLLYGIVCLVSGIKKEKKSFIWLSGFGEYIKNPTLNIIYGIILISISILGIIWYGAQL